MIARARTDSRTSGPTKLSCYWCGVCSMTSFARFLMARFARLSLVATPPGAALPPCLFLAVRNF